MKITKPYLLLLLVFLLGSILRFYNLGGVPVGFHRDEAYFGYNAYSLFLTGHDISGNFLPIHLEAFLFSPAGYSYFAIPFIAMFGLSEFSTRLPSALFGSLTIPLVYFLVRQLFSNYRYKDTLGIAASFFLAISPWHINLSRVTTENVLVVFFITLGVLLYLFWVQTKRWWLLVLSMVCFSSTLLMYQAPRAFLPLFLPLLFLFFHPKPLKKNILLPSVLFIVTIIVPILVILASPTLTERLRMLSIFHHPETQLVLNEQIREDGSSGSIALTRVFHNKVVDYSQTFLFNYFDHFSYNFLFTDSGLPDRYRVSRMGLLYLFEIPLLLWGIVSLIIQHRRRALFLFCWILLAPFGTALTFDDVPNLQRTLIIFPALSIVTAYGFVQFWNFLGSYKYTKIMRLLSFAIIAYGVFYYLHQYYIHQVYHRPWFRQEGYKELIARVNSLGSQYKNVAVTDSQSAPAIFFLFYNHYDPQQLQQRLAQNPNGTYETVAFPNYKFVKKACPLYIESLVDKKTGLVNTYIKGEKNTLYVNAFDCKTEDERIEMLGKIQRKDGTQVFILQALK